MPYWIAKCPSGAVSAEIRLMKSESKVGNVPKRSETKPLPTPTLPEQKSELEIVRF